VAVPTGEFGIQ